MIRDARGDDAATIHAICAPAVSVGTATFETVLPAVNAMRERIRNRLQHYPWLVWEEAGEVLAYAYAGRFRERAAYGWIAKISIYVHHGARRCGIAKRLYSALLNVVPAQGIIQTMAVITLPGSVSVALHESIGFTPANGDSVATSWGNGGMLACGRSNCSHLRTNPTAIIPFERLRNDAGLHALLN